ncbi:MAG: HAMP domain-containing sensor histidine kinase [Rickettsiales bacterium]|nr:HAMP domain-containing sensor histidine kinase [Rickettsiales bacterium]
MIAITGLASWGGYTLRMSATDDIVKSIKRNNQALGQGYVNNIWSFYRDTIVNISFSDHSQVRDNQQIANFARDTLRYFQPAPLIRANIYVRGQLLISADGSTPTPLAMATGSPDITFVSKNIRSNSPADTILEGVELKTGGKAVLLQTIVPIRSEHDAPDTAIELLYDLTNPWEELVKLQLYSIGSVIGASLLFLTITLLIANRAEVIIAKLHEENTGLEAKAAAAQAENREKSQFLANISHELRTPLNAIIGFSDILKTEVIAAMNNQKYTNYISDIHASGVHLLSLINDILDYSKAEAGKLEVEVSEVNASKMVHNCMRLVSARAESGKVTLVETLPKEQITMLVDGKKFKQIILNLLSNAVKFTPAGGEVKISAWHNLAEDSYTFEVSDTGIGIAAKDISIALSPFGQIDSALSRKYEGTGLGLPLTKKFVELMGGTFAIKSKVGAGTTITFTLPRQIVSTDDVIVKQAT